MEETTMPKGWNNLSEEAKLGYVSAEFVEKVDDAMSLAREETKNMTDDEYLAFISKIMQKHVDPV